ncbi:MAG: hypothetical protein IIC73_00855 [Armatimonadetes bacterium]|nr:hypothetical protein [Armatimonadota bacterium]
MKRHVVITIFGVLFVVSGALWIWLRAIETANRAPATMPVFVFYAREAFKRARATGYRHVPGNDTLGAYNLTKTEITDTILFSGLSPVMIFRFPMSGFTESNSDAYMMDVYLDPGKVSGKKVLNIGDKSFHIRQLFIWDSDTLLVPELLNRTVSDNRSPVKHYGKPSSVAYRLWINEEASSYDSPPALSLMPIFQADWFVDGNWEGTVAFFDDDQRASDVTLLHK